MGDVDAGSRGVGQSPDQGNLGSFDNRRAGRPAVFELDAREVLDQRLVL